MSNELSKAIKRKTDAQFRTMGEDRTPSISEGAGGSVIILDPGQYQIPYVAGKNVTIGTSGNNKVINAVMNVLAGQNITVGEPDPDTGAVTISSNIGGKTIDLSGLADGYVLKYDSVSDSFIVGEGGGGGLAEIPQATETTLGGIKAKAKTSETTEVAIDSATGKLYVKTAELPDYIMTDNDGLRIVDDQGIVKGLIGRRVKEVETPEYRLIHPTTISASSTASGRSPSDAFDGSYTSFWRCDTINTGWLRFDFLNPVCIRKYTMYASPEYNVRSPKSWNLEGSSDGTTWEIVDSRVNYPFLPAFGNGAFQTFEINNSKMFVYYRINVLETGEATTPQIAELEVYDIPGLVYEYGIFPEEAPESGGSYTLPQATETTLGGIKARAKTTETAEVAIDPATGKLYSNAPDEAANGLPAGGTVGQILSKVDGTDYNAEWIAPPSGGGSGKGVLLARTVTDMPAATGSRIITFDTVERLDDIFTFNDIDSVTILQSGYYFVSGHVRLTTGDSGYKVLSFKKNGASSIRGGQHQATAVEIDASGVDYFLAGDVVTMDLYTGNSTTVIKNRFNTYLRIVQL